MAPRWTSVECGPLNTIARSYAQALSVALLLLLATDRSGAADDPGTRLPSVKVSGTQFNVTLASGLVLTSADLIGAVLEAIDDTGRAITVRIEAVTRDLSDPDGDVWLHRFSALEPETGRWHPICMEGSSALTEVGHHQTGNY